MGPAQKSRASGQLGAQANATNSGAASASDRAGTRALNYFYLSSAVALVHDEVRPDQRVLSGALLLLVMNLIGMGVGPTLVGALSDSFHAAHPHNSLQLAFLWLVPVYGLAILLFLALAGVLKPTPSGVTS